MILLIDGTSLFIRSYSFLFVTDESNLPVLANLSMSIPRDAKAVVVISFDNLFSCSSLSLFLLIAIILSAASLLRISLILFNVAEVSFVSLSLNISLTLSIADTTLSISSTLSKSLFLSTSPFIYSPSSIYSLTRSA